MACRAIPPEEASVSGSTRLRALAAQPFGPYLLTVVALGLAVYGVFCFVDARYHQFEITQRARLSTTPRGHQVAEDENCSFLPCALATVARMPAASSRERAPRGRLGRHDGDLLEQAETRGVVRVGDGRAG